MAGEDSEREKVGAEGVAVNWVVEGAAGRDTPAHSETRTGVQWPNDRLGGDRSASREDRKY